MVRLFTLTLLLIAAFLPRPAAAQAPVTWQRCFVHLAWAHPSQVTSSSCHRFPIRRAHLAVIGERTTIVRLSPHVERVTRYPTFARPVVSTAPAALPAAGGASYTETMLVTWYGPTGSPMANGVYPSVGWAACGYDLPLGARVAVAGLGTYTCGDRIGFDPWHHVDLFDVPAAGAGYRSVTVYP